jgi:tRNA(Ile)-lysidine synthase
VFKRESPLPRGTHILLAVSGGPDSMAMLHAMSLVREEFGLLLSAHGVDHGLRAAASTELEVAAGFAHVSSIPFGVSRVSLGDGGNLQARARHARYAALRAAAASAGADLIATAHHADDRAETVLLRLLRGAGVSGLAVLPVRSLDLVRPLIRAQRTDIVRHLQRHRVPSCDDPSNADFRFLRVRVRQQLLPLLTQLSPQIVNHLTNLADQASMRNVPTLLDQRGEAVWLNRAQAVQLGELLRSSQATGRIALSGGRGVSIDTASRQPVVVSDLPHPHRVKRKRQKC